MQAMSSAVLSSAINHLSVSRTRIAEDPSLGNRPFGNSPVGCAQPSCWPMHSTTNYIFLHPEQPQQQKTKNKETKTLKWSLSKWVFFLLGGVGMGWIGFNRNSISTVFPEKGKNFQMASTLILKIQPQKKIM